MTGAKVKAGSLQQSDFATGQLPIGPAGPAGPGGPPGPPGPAGPGAQWVFVGKDGNVISNSPGLRVQINHPSQGAYYLTFGAPVTSRAFFVTPAYRNADIGFKGSYNVASCGGPPAGAQCPASGYGSSSVYVGMFNPTNSFLEDHAFYFVLF